MSFFKNYTPKLSTPKLSTPKHPLLSYKQHTKVAMVNHYIMNPSEKEDGNKEDVLKKNEAEIERLEKLIINLSKEKKEKEYKNKSWYNKVGNFVSSTIGLNTTEDTDKQKKLKKELLELEEKNNTWNATLDQQKQARLKKGPLSMETATFLDQCLKKNGIKSKFTNDSGKEINYICYSSDGNYEYARRVVESKRRIDGKPGYDLIFKIDDSAKHGYVFKDYKNGDTVERGWTPLKPGDIIYHPCVVKAIAAEHAAIYIGCGAVIHLWHDKGRLARIICTSVRETASVNKPCELLIVDKAAHNNDLGTDIHFKATKDILKDALASLRASRLNQGHGYYGELTNNCHQWVMDIATNKGLPMWIPGKGYTHSIIGELYRTGKPRVSTRMNLPAHKKISRNLQKRRRKEIYSLRDFHK